MIRYGEENGEVYLIKTGEVRIMSKSEEKDDLNDTECARLGIGQFVGEQTSVMGKIYITDCIASGQVEVLSIPKKTFRSLDIVTAHQMEDYEATYCVLKVKFIIK